MKAVFFDFDGVIVNSERLHWQALVRVLEPLDLAFSWEEYFQGYIGCDDRDVFRIRFNRAGRELDAARLKECLAGKATAFQDLIRDSPPSIYPGVRELIRDLRGRVPMAICTGAVASDIAPILESLQLRSDFGAIVTAEDVAASKPNPDCYKLARKQLAQTAGVPDTAVFGVAIEDTPAGIAAARGAGMQVLAVATTHPADELHAADRVIHRLTDIPTDEILSLCGEPTA